MKKKYIIFLLIMLCLNFLIAQANTIKVNLGKDKCFCKNGHYNGPARNYVWSSSNPKPDDNMLNTFPLYVRTPKCLKFYK